MVAIVNVSVIIVAVVVVLFALLGKLAVLVAEHNQYKQRMLEVTEKVPTLHRRPEQFSYCAAHSRRTAMND